MRTGYNIVSIVIILLVLPFVSIGQEVVPFSLEVKREMLTKPYPKSKLRLELWVQESEKFMGLDSSKTRISVWKDNLDHDLLLAHDKAVRAFGKKVLEASQKGRLLFSSRSKKIIDISNSVGFRDTIGFKLALENWTVPSKNSTKIRIKAKLVYWVPSEGDEQNTTLENIVLSNAKSIRWQSRSIPIRKSGSTRINGESFVSYEISTAHLGAAVVKVEKVGDDGEAIKKLSRFKATHKLRFEVNEKNSTQPMNIRFSYFPLKTKVLDFDKEFSIGL